MNALVDGGLLRQHLIDPEICIRCNTCEATCPIGAVTHDDRNYVVKADVCNGCMACVPPCPTGAIDNWRKVPVAAAYPIEEQLQWDTLPAELPPEQLAEAGGDAIAADPASAPAEAPAASATEDVFDPRRYNATLPPWSAAHAYTNLYGPKSPLTVTVAGNIRVTDAGTESDTHHIVLDFGAMPFPVLEGQSIGLIAPGGDAQGRALLAREYSIASPRNG